MNMSTRLGRVWFQILAFSTIIACAVAVLMATLGTAAAGAAAGVESAQTADPSPIAQTYEGMITDTRCGAKHQASISKSAADCVRVCAHGGAQFALVDGEKTYILNGDLSLLKKVAGERAKIGGSLNGNTITVSSITTEQ
jgi:hypothetical protein